MSLSKTIVNKPVTLIIVFIALIVVGIFTASNLAIDLYPEINPPVLVIFTDYTGNGPEEIEKIITRPLESVLSNVSNIDEINSVSMEDFSQIIVSFGWGTDMNEAANDVRDKLEMAKDYLPDEASTPMIFKFDPSMMPILYLTLSGRRPQEELKKIADDIIQPRLEQVEGVSAAGVNGGREQIIRIDVPQSRLAAYNLTMTQLAQMMAVQNMHISAGSITEGSKSFIVRTTGEFASIDEIKNVVIGYKGGQINPLTGVVSKVNEIKLSDIANVYKGFRDEEEMVLIDGEPAVYLSVQKQSGVNSVQTVDRALVRAFGYKDLKQKELDGKIPFNLKKRGAIIDSLPEDVEFQVLYDQTKLIRATLSQITSSLILGALLAIIILFIFLRSFKSVIIIGLSIPISFLITLMLMYFAGLTLNMMTLTGLALGIGMLVDNSIVILENIYKYREKGAKVKTASILGTQEMINAIVASTLTTICVFLPIVMFKAQLEMIGELFNGLAFTVVISLVASLAVAIFLVPILTSKVLPLTNRKENPLKGVPKVLDDGANKFFTGMDNGYKKILGFFIKHKIKFILMIIGIFIGSLFLIGITGTENIPSMGEDAIEVKVELPVGTRLEETKQVMTQFEDIIKKEFTYTDEITGEERQGYKNIMTVAGEKSFFGFMGKALTHKGALQIFLPPKKERRWESEEVKRKMRKYFKDFPNAVFSFQQNMMGPSSDPVDILVKTNDLDKGIKIANKIKELLKKHVPEALEPEIDINDGLPEVRIVIDRAKAYSLGLNIMSIGSEIKANNAGIVASRYREGGDELDILLILDERDRSKIPNLEKIFVTTQTGSRIPLASIANIKRGTGPVDIRRENQTRVIHVTASLDKKGGTNLNEVGIKIDRLIKNEIAPDDDVIIEQSGEFQEQQENGLKMLAILLLSVFLVFAVMAAQFESFVDPFIILFTIPLTITGVIWAHFIARAPISMFSMAGMVVLAGLVVNNGIVMVDYTNLLRKRGMRILDAAIEAAGSRLRPILMTTLTTILGMLPMALSHGEGSDISRPLAMSIVGGLSVSSIFTLFLIPTIYVIVNNRIERRKKRKRIKKKLIERQMRLEGVL